ncbi:MAG: GDP-mannose 4,6-dehydratase [Ponticaulis sp.]|nr:GDP-mannose 4,6-dehydratase [Ponticaulis sp.]|tara:strand:+ start:42800 stop:43822 length:1023 start_codon:yes stop_codon:yes gene_type:complete
MSEADTVLIFGVTGQDGAYLAKLLLGQGCRVFGTCRNTEPENLWRLSSLGIAGQIDLKHCDLGQVDQIEQLISDIRPDQIYNLAAVSSLDEAYADPDGTQDVNGHAVQAMLDTAFGVRPDTRFFQASSAQIFGNTEVWPQTETSARSPQTPYATAKIIADDAVKAARGKGHFAVSGILYNHESPLRTDRFVSRKIAAGLVRLVRGNDGPLRLGSLDAQRDWSFAGDIMRGAALALSHPNPQDYILASGVPHRVRDWVEIGAAHLGLELEWRGRGVEEIGIDAVSGRTIIETDPAFYRAVEPARLIGDPSRAKRHLGWSAEVDLTSLVKLMIEAELARLSD